MRECFCSQPCLSAVAERRPLRPPVEGKREICFNAIVEGCRACSARFYDHSSKQRESCVVL